MLFRRPSWLSRWLLPVVTLVLGVTIGLTFAPALPWGSVKLGDWFALMGGILGAALSAGLAFVFVEISRDREVGRWRDDLREMIKRLRRSIAKAQGPMTPEDWQLLERQMAHSKNAVRPMLRQQNERGEFWLFDDAEAIGKLETGMARLEAYARYRIDGNPDLTGHFQAPPGPEVITETIAALDEADRTLRR